MPRHTAWNFVDRDGKQDVVRISGRFLANSGDVLLALVLRGGGVAIAPDYLVEDDLKAGRLIRLLPEYATPETAVHAVYPHARHLSAKTRTFIGFLASRFVGSHQIEQDGGTD
jgi:DNA-binding transcriptional LysR family regulator